MPTALQTALAAAATATITPLEHSAGFVVHVPGYPPMILTPETAQAWVLATFTGLSDEDAATVAQRLLEAAPPPVPKPKLRKLTVLMEPALAQTLMAERARIAAVEGINVSLSALATRAMRAGFGRLDAGA